MILWIDRRRELLHISFAAFPRKVKVIAIHEKVTGGFALITCSHREVLPRFNKHILFLMSQDYL